MSRNRLSVVLEEGLFGKQVCDDLHGLSSLAGGCVRPIGFVFSAGDGSGTDGQALSMMLCGNINVALQQHCLLCDINSLFTIT
jgi:hypothetical protein